MIISIYHWITWYDNIVTGDDCDDGDNDDGDGDSDDVDDDDGDEKQYSWRDMSC